MFGIGTTELILLAFVVIVVASSAYGWLAVYRRRPVGPVLLMAVVTMLVGIFPAETEWQSALWLAAVLRLAGLTGVVIGLVRLTRGKSSSQATRRSGDDAVLRQSLGISSRSERSGTTHLD